MLVISTNLSQLSDLNWVMRVTTLFSAWQLLGATSPVQSVQSVTNQVKIRIKLSLSTGSDYYAWKILITGGRTCPDQCFQWLTDWLTDWPIIGVQNNSRLIFPPRIYPLALWIEIFVRGMLEFTSYNKLISKLLRSLTEFYELVTAIWFVETLCCHLASHTSPQHLMRKTWNFPNRNMQPSPAWRPWARGTIQTTHKEDFVAKTWE